MAMDYLRAIAEAAFPLEVSDQHGMQCVHVLRAADLVEADIFDDDTPGACRRAVVHRITYQGWAVLERDSGHLPLA
jgi:hypothetical protein